MTTTDRAAKVAFRYWFAGYQCGYQTASESDQEQLNELRQVAGDFIERLDLMGNEAEADELAERLGFPSRQQQQPQRFTIEHYSGDAATEPYWWVADHWQVGSDGERLAIGRYSVHAEALIALNALIDCCGQQLPQS